MTDTADAAYRAGVLQEVLRFCQTPKTAEEIGEHFGWHTQTARMKLWELQENGKIRALPRKRDRKKLWQAQSGTVQGITYAMTSAGTFALKDLAVWSDTRASHSNLIGGCLAYLWRRAYYKQKDQSDVKNVARQGGLDPLLDVRQGMSEVHRQMTIYFEALSQMLIDMPELWEDGVGPFKMLGLEVDQFQIEEAASKFEAWMTQYLDSQGETKHG